MIIKKLTLDQPVTYEIKVPGALNQKWLDWNGGLTVTYERDEKDDQIAILTITVDQAALHGLLQHLYSLGLPLIAVNWVDYSEG